jgi:multidrug efflux system outer membrane protein
MNNLSKSRYHFLAVRLYTVRSFRVPHYGSQAMVCPSSTRHLTMPPGPCSTPPRPLQEGGARSRDQKGDRTDSGCHFSERGTAALALLISILFVFPAVSIAQNSSDLPVITNSSLSYQDALAFAMRGNFDLKVAQDNLSAARAAAAASKASLMPGWSTTTYGAYGDMQSILSSSPGVSPQNILNTSRRGFADQNLALMAPIYTGGKLQKLALSARLDEKSLSMSESAARFDVAESVIEDYTLAALDNDLILVAKSRVDDEVEQVRVTQENVEQGHSAPVDLLREQAELADSNQELTSAQNDEQIALVNLKDAMGVSQESTIVISDTLDSLNAVQQPPGSLSDVLQLADTRSPVIKAAEYQADAATADVGAAKGAFSPQVYGVAMSDASSMGGVNNVGYTVGIAASLPLYDAGQRRDEVDSAKAKLASLRDGALRVKQQVERNAAEAWLNLQTANALLQSAEAGMTAAQQSYDLENMRYNAGKSIAAERLDALTALVKAREAESAARASQVITKAKLEQTIGE